ncbi:AlpA family phage regulatory protein [Ramlibacter ginsenosidimutans]|uniref:AlpA family phage regulatory protein n=1 Tax=Ramlibacter ginsenosidimutans TaxID=502333 RepID=A0A934TZD3_9BURK|nr:AlpA family phage regulatory protein [Ramlibacter ginsenosidimutans]MBK6008812.1 AlpA family phage regulatory protein [Ramlibacter ginsenosidimutans]
MPNLSLRAAQAAPFLGISLPTFWRWVREKPDFPKPIRLSPRCTVFDADALLAWRDARAQPHATPQTKRKSAR